MSDLHLFVLGKFKNSNYEALEKDYLVRMKSPKLNIIELKARAEDSTWEGQQILKKAKDLKITNLVLLDEKGKEFNSREFSDWLYKTIELGPTAFCIGGAEGHSDELKKTAGFTISLSKQTLPHKLARVVLVEQLYRAQCLKSGHPYHND